MTRRTPLRALTVLVSVLLVVVAVGGCSAPLKHSAATEKTTPPALGTCYRLTPKDTDAPSSSKAPVACSGPHTAQTFAIGTLPASLGKDYRSPALGKWIYPRCEKSFERFLGVDESLALRVQLSWAWFRADEDAWKKGTRWYRCDVVGGIASAASYAALPANAKGLFRAKPPEQWLACAKGATVLRSEKVACTEPHDWRAVTTIKLGGPKDRYPGDRLVQVRSRDFCSDSVGAWMNYPVGYEFGYTWFHQAEWDAGNRRSICWAKTDR